jgi:hypothetical protein
MTTTTPATRTRRSDDGLDNDTGTLMKLPEGALPCRSCGAAVRHPKPERAEALRIPMMLSHAQVMMMNGLAPLDSLPATTCDRCADRRERAVALLDAHSRVRRAHGQVALDRADAALAALDVLGWRGWRTGWAVNPLTTSDEDVMRFIDVLAPFGAAASFNRYARGGIAASSRWGHVPGVLRRDAAVAHRELLHRRFEGVGPVPPPADGVAGCLLCGLGHVKGRMSDQADLWGQLREVRPGVLGGRGADRIRGYLCPACRRAVEEGGGALGQPAVDRALLAQVGYRVSGGRVIRALGHAWCVLPAGTPTWDESWSHVDTTKLRRQFDESPYAVKVEPKGRR